MSARDAAAQRRGRQPQQGAANTPARQGDPANTMRVMLDRMKGEFATALPAHIPADRLLRHALTAFRTTPKLDECTPASFLGALMTCAQIGLEPGPQGYVYILPFWNSRARSHEATFILGYKGMMELARRSSELVDISAHTIYENEVKQGRFTVEYGTSPRIEHKPIVFGDRGQPVGYYARATLRNGGTPFVVLSKDEVDEFRKRSMTQKDNPSGPWSSDYEPMAWKTCVRRLSRWLPQSSELAAGLAHEDTVRNVVAGTAVTSVLDQQPPALETDETEPAALEQTRQEAPAQPVEQPRPEREPAPQQRPQQAPVQRQDEAPEPPLPDPADEDDPWANV